MVDLLIRGGVAYTMDASRRIIRDGAVAVEGDTIVDVDPVEEVEGRHSAERVIDATGMAVLPGFVNVHTHLPSIFVRGVYGVVREGLYQVLFPVKEYLKPEHCYTFGLASCIEALNSGSTTIQETYNYMAPFARAVEETGMRADLGEQIAEADYQKIRDGEYLYRPEQAEEMLERALRLKRDWHGRAGGRITVSWAPLAPDMCTPWVYERVLEHAEPGEKISTHVAQSEREIQQVRRLYGKTPVEHLTELGVMGPDLLGAHCVYTTPSDLKTLREAGACVLHCPRPFLLDGATAALSQWLEMGIKVGLGTDNVHHAMWETMRAAVYGARVREAAGTGGGGPSYYEVLELATIRGAEIMGMAARVGSLEPGKKADIQLIDLNDPHITPTVDLTSSLVLYGSTASVDTVIIDGEVVKDGGRVTVVDVEECLREAQVLAEEVWDALFSDRPGLEKLVKG